ncbi:MAG: zf-HC2 domain-containing protein, partial [Oscillospiraceae bacterium]|nr:zf-HC2 domain-containing protein [Oscillospiraceae bacterium]
MSKIGCELIQDLLPLYAENMCSEESRRIVAEHIAECSDCKGKLAKMNTDIKVRPDDDISVIRRIKKRILIEKIGISAAIALFLITSVIIGGYFMLGTTRHMDYERY